jgi:hypothetical protein
MDRGTGEPGQDDPQQGPRPRSRWTRALTPEVAAKALVALGRIAELIGFLIQHCD